MTRLSTGCGVLVGPPSRGLERHTEPTASCQRRRRVVPRLHGKRDRRSGRASGDAADPHRGVPVEDRAVFGVGDLAGGSLATCQSASLPPRSSRRPAPGQPRRAPWLDHRLGGASVGDDGGRLRIDDLRVPGTDRRQLDPRGPATSTIRRLPTWRRNVRRASSRSAMRPPRSAQARDAGCSSNVAPSEVTVIRRSNGSHEPCTKLKRRQGGFGRATSGSVMSWLTPTPNVSGAPSNEVSWRPVARNQLRTSGRRSGSDAPRVQITYPPVASS
jgi:hypothetical protein